MEILQFLLSFFANEYGGGKFAPVLELLKENSFDIMKTLKNINPQVIAPILKDMFSAQENKIFKSGTATQTSGLAPVVNVADKEIVYVLNKYLAD